MTLASIPSPSISTFEIGPLTIHLYALCILAGIIAAVAITTARWKRVGGDFDQILDIAIVSVLAVSSARASTTSSPRPNGSSAPAAIRWR